MKKLINNPEDVVNEALEGLALAHPDLVRVHYEPNFVAAPRRPRDGQSGDRLGRRVGA